MKFKKHLLPPPRSIPATNQAVEVGHKSELTENGPSIPEAANQLGIDAFSMYELIQLGAVQSERASSGRFFLPKPQIEALLQGSAADF